MAKVNCIDQHLELPDKGRNEPKSNDKAVNKKVKKLLKQNEQEMVDIRLAFVNNLTLILMCDKTNTVPGYSNPHDIWKDSNFAHNKIWEVLTTLNKKFRVDSFLDQFKLDKDKMTIIIKRG